MLQGLAPKEIEKKYVYDIYSQIATDFDKTRYNIWPSVETFLTQELNMRIKTDSCVNIFEGRCGNGKNLAFYQAAIC